MSMGHSVRIVTYNHKIAQLKRLPLSLECNSELSDDRPLRSTALFVLLSNKCLDIEGFSLPGNKRSNAVIDHKSEPPEFFNVRQQLLADSFLIGVRQAGYFRDSQFKRLDHVAPYHVGKPNAL